MRFEAERDDDDGGIPDLPSGLERTGNAPPYPGSPKFGYGRSANGKKKKTETMTFDLNGRMPPLKASAFKEGVQTLREKKKTEKRERSERGSNKQNGRRVEEAPYGTEREEKSSTVHTDPFRKRERIQSKATARNRPGPHRVRVFQDIGGFLQGLADGTVVPSPPSNQKRRVKTQKARGDARIGIIHAKYGYRELLSSSSTPTPNHPSKLETKTDSDEEETTARAGANLIMKSGWCAKFRGKQ
ncbi:hypothetical protein V9T40_011390 [Parthenolecanium corni]|uniref:Uncharacterized protein n=1 Tax=Parthenolecanium corni TaxID=536013 RepID=A0AAN9XYJ6_9HEMI